jgi:hypothetical protein
MRWLGILSIAALLLFGTPAGRHVVALAVALLSPTGAFRPWPGEPRVLAERGADSLARPVAAALPAAIARVEAGMGERFARPVRVRCCATHASFSRFTAMRGPAGAVIRQRLFLSPKLLRTPQRVPAVLAHELAHLELMQRTGTLAFVRLPAWFKEGLATWVSGGGGAETVDEAAARDSLLAGAHLVPVSGDAVLFPDLRGTRRMVPHLFYRQAAMFVAHLDAAHPGRLRALLVDLERGAGFRPAFGRAFGVTTGKAWEEFAASQRRTTAAS